MVATTHKELWRERLTAPTYRLMEAARYARTSNKTIRNWEKLQGNRRFLSGRREGEALSYLQLIEVGVVAAMRKSKLTLDEIRQARDYMRREFNSPYPFAHYRFKTDGKTLFMDYDQIIPSEKEKLLNTSESGQLAWNQILGGLLQEFEYDADLGTVLRWRVDGMESPIRIDPRIAFGSPHVGGIPTWVLRNRWKSGEGIGDIAEDYELASDLVTAALRFEHVEVDPDRPHKWMQ
jgi:uncharacterized protein (DUF433 family)